MSDISLEDVVQYFYKTASAETKLALGITEGADIKRKREVASSSGEEEGLHIYCLCQVSYLADTAYREADDIKSSPLVGKEAGDGSEESGSAEEKLQAVIKPPPAATEDLEQEALVMDYLKKVTPGIAREFQV